MPRLRLAALALAAVTVAAAVLAPPAAPAERPGPEQTLARARALHVGAEAQAARRHFLPGARLRPGGRAVTRGATRLGGRPDLPAGAHWPTCRGRRLSFLAQVDLGELDAAVPGATRGRGLLSVFADIREPDRGVPGVEEFDGHVRRGTCVAVRHSTATRAQLHRRRHTPPGTPTLRETAVRLRPTLTVPNWVLIEVLLGRRLSRTQFNRWFRLYDETAWGVLGRRPPFLPVHQLLGWSSPVQDDPTYSCGRTRAHHLPARRLLLQLDFDERLRFAVGDGGALYLTILPQDLRAGRFDRLCATFQEG
jgi:hypothetical protein